MCSSVVGWTSFHLLHRLASVSRIVRGLRLHGTIAGSTAATPKRSRSRRSSSVTTSAIAKNRLDETSRPGDLEPRLGQKVAHFPKPHLVEEQNARRISHGDGRVYAGLCPSGTFDSEATGVWACGADAVSGADAAGGCDANAGVGIEAGGVETAEAVGVVTPGASGARAACLSFRLRFFVTSLMLGSVKESIYW